jgi:hypothetical protein
MDKWKARDELRMIWTSVRQGAYSATAFVVIFVTVVLALSWCGVHP